MIQIDMPMPEKCEDCIFCGDSCSCVASEYDGKGINVGCAFRTGRRDIRCPLTEQEAVEPYIAGRGESFETAETWWYECGNCNKPIDPNDKFCRHCGRALRWK